MADADNTGVWIIAGGALLGGFWLLSKMVGTKFKVGDRVADPSNTVGTVVQIVKRKEGTAYVIEYDNPAFGSTQLFERYLTKVVSPVRSYSY